MPKPFEAMDRPPHRKLTRLDERLLTVVGDLHMPFGDFPRRMTIVRLLDAQARDFQRNRASRGRDEIDRSSRQACVPGRSQRFPSDGREDLRRTGTPT